MNDAILTGSMATTEALRAIFKHENLPFTTGVGPSGSVVMINQNDLRKATTVLRQWERAVQLAIIEVGKVQA